MRKYVAQRLLQMPVVLFFISIIVFSLMHIAPGDPVELMLGDYFTTEDANKLRRNLGLDRPLYVQYFDWVWGATHLDFGNSFHTLQPISEMIAERAPVYHLPGVPFRRVRPPARHPHRDRRGASSQHDGRLYVHGGCHVRHQHPELRPGRAVDPGSRGLDGSSPDLRSRRSAERSRRLHPLLRDAGDRPGHGPARTLQPHACGPVCWRCSARTTSARRDPRDCRND